MQVRIHNLARFYYISPAPPLHLTCISAVSRQVRIHNLARFYYDAVPMEAPSAKGDAGSIADLTGFRLWECAPACTSTRATCTRTTSNMHTRILQPTPRLRACASPHRCAPHLIAHIAAHRALVSGRSVLELGAGTGAVGLAAAACGASRVVLSDADSVVTLKVHGTLEHASHACIHVCMPPTRS